MDGAQQESEVLIGLPRGCIETPSKLPFSRVRKLDEHQWIKVWSEKEEIARSLFQAVAGAAISGKLDRNLYPMLNKVDQDTGLVLRVLLARSLDKYKKGELVVATNNRMGLRSNGGVTAVGGKFHFGVQIGNTLSGQRKAEGEFVGVVLNVDSSPIRNISKKGESSISGDHQLDILSALIESEIAAIKVEKEGRSGEIFSQEELSRATDFVLFDKR